MDKELLQQAAYTYVLSVLRSERATLDYSFEKSLFQHILEVDLKEKPVLILLTVNFSLEQELERVRALYLEEHPSTDASEMAPIAFNPQYIEYIFNELTNAIYDEWDFRRKEITQIRSVLSITIGDMKVRSQAKLEEHRLAIEKLNEALDDLKKSLGTLRNTQAIYHTR